MAHKNPPIVPAASVYRIYSWNDATKINKLKITANCGYWDENAQIHKNGERLL